jgi:hypothetical protein
MTTRSTRHIFLVAALALVLGTWGTLSTATAQEEGRLQLRDLNQEEGWVKLLPGVWQQRSEDGNSLLRASGTEGLAFGLDLLRAQQTTLVERFLENPSKEEFQALEHHNQFIREVEEGLQASKLTQIAPVKPALPPCDYNFHIDAQADPSLACATALRAQATYSTTCSETCSVYSYTAWSATCGSQTLSNSSSCSDNGTNVDCFTWANYAPVNYSSLSINAYAYIYCPALGSLFLNDSDSYSVPSTAWCNC